MNRKRCESFQIKPLLAWAILLTLTIPVAIPLAAQDLPADLKAPQGSPGAPRFFLPLVGHGTLGTLFFSTEITLVNLSTEPSGGVTVTTFDPSGTPLNLLNDSTVPVSALELESLSGSGTFSLQSLNEQPETRLDSGWASVAAESPMRVEVVFRIVDTETDTLLASANVSVPGARLEAIFTGRVRPGVDTGLALLNPPVNQAAVVTIRAVNADGQLEDSQEISLQPGERTSEFITQILDLEDFEGSIEVDSPVSIAILPLRQEGVVLTTQGLFPFRQ